MLLSKQGGPNFGQFCQFNAVAANVSFVEIESNKGHDAFLLHEPELFDTVRGFLSAAARHRGVKLPDEGA